MKIAPLLNTVIISIAVTIHLINFFDPKDPAPPQPPPPVVEECIGCNGPITYRMGTFDPRFGISQEAFLATAKAAEAEWEKAVGKDLLNYDPNGTIPINMVFDDRQKVTFEIMRLERILRRYRAQKIVTKLDDNTLIIRPDLYEHVNAICDEQSRLYRFLNENPVVGMHFGGPNQSIEVYRFEATYRLRGLLVHEFGHALNVPHSENERSVMYAEAQNVRHVCFDAPLTQALMAGDLVPLLSSKAE